MRRPGPRRPDRPPPHRPRANAGRTRCFPSSPRSPSGSDSPGAGVSPTDRVLRRRCIRAPTARRIRGAQRADPDDRAGLPPHTREIPMRIRRPFISAGAALACLLAAFTLAGPATARAGAHHHPRANELHGVTQVTTAPGIAGTLLKAGIVPLPVRPTRFGVHL